MCAHALVSGRQGCTKSNICFEICKKSLRLPAEQRRSAQIGEVHGAAGRRGEKEREEWVYAEERTLERC